MVDRVPRTHEVPGSSPGHSTTLTKQQLIGKTHINNQLHAQHPIRFMARWPSLVGHSADNRVVAGSNPVRATTSS